MCRKRHNWLSFIFFVPVDALLALVSVDHVLCEWELPSKKSGQ